MEWGELSEDQLDVLIIQSETEIAKLRAIEMAAIATKKALESHHADGYRSIVDWVAARADVSHRTARSLCWTATRLSQAPEIAERLASGEISFDRAEQLARLPEEHRRGHEGFDIAQLRRRVAHYRRLSPAREKKVSQNGFVNFQPSWDETTTRFWGELAGVDSRLVEKAVDQRADELISAADRLPVAERRALALVSICQDSLYEGTAQDDSPPTQVTVTVEARAAAPSQGQAGVSILTGPRIGSRALEAILCNGIVDVIGITEQGIPIGLGRKTRTVSNKLRQFVHARDGGCTVEGCSSRYRLEAHHITPWSRGGTTNPDNLTTLCWYHHHVAIHKHGLQIFRIGTSRIRLKQPKG